jgi:hypothetical protein
MESSENNLGVWSKPVHIALMYRQCMTLPASVPLGDEWTTESSRQISIHGLYPLEIQLKKY